MTDRPGLDAAVDEVRSRRSAHPDGLVNDAGFDGFGQFLKITRRDWNQVLEGEPDRHVPLLPGHPTGMVAPAGGGS